MIWRAAWTILMAIYAEWPAATIIAGALLWCGIIIAVAAVL